MTRRGHHPIDKAVLKRIAMQMHLHLQTHPERIARRMGISVSYVRQCWRELEMREMARLTDEIETIFAEES